MSDEEPLPPPEPPEAGAAGDAEPGRKIPRWAKWFAGVSALIALVGLAGALIRLPYYTLSPGAALNVEPRVNVTGTKTYPDRGVVMLLFVRERARVNVWRWVQGALDPDIDLVKEKLILGNQSPEENNTGDISAMAQSQIAARAAALSTLGYHLRFARGVLVTAVLPSKPAAKVLRAGDQILAADGHALEQLGDLSAIVQRHRAGTSVTLRVVRAGHVRTERAGVVAGKSGDQTVPIIGVFASLTYEFPVRIELNTNDISGPSAGLAMTLAIIDDLTPGDLTGGKRVAVTGTITPDGQVGEIGAIEQKAVAAKAAHAQIFIVPTCVKDASQAACLADLGRAEKRVGKHVDVEPVATLAQALRVLRAAGGAPVHPRSGA